MSRLFCSFFFIAIFCFAAAAQNPVAWKLDSPARGSESSGPFKAELTATIEAPWHLYAVEQPKGGPIPTTISIPDGSNFQIKGKIESPHPIERFDENFKIPTKFFENEVTFTVSIESLAGAQPDDLALKVKYQVCNETTCLPPRTVKVTFAGTETIGGLSLASSSPSTPVAAINQQAAPADTDLWAFLWLAATFGAISLLTPCVFPMIPITVSYFMKHSDGHHKRAISLATVYSAGIIATFSLLGMLLAFVFGAAGINLFAANPWVNLFIGALFLVFAFNLFGFYEISIPSSVLTKLDKLTRAEEGKGSAYIGALLMGLTFTLTSFTCTSPFIGTMLVSTAQGDWKMPLLGMIVFSTVFAVPFFILAVVPRLLHSLPRSGGWLNSVKVVMGFLEVAAAMKFLSNVDLVWGAGFNKTGALNYGMIFTREVVLIIWVVIGIAITGYVLGFFKFRHDSAVKKLTPLRLVVAAGFLFLAGFLTTGVAGKKLGELESFLPPKNHDSRFNVLGDPNADLDWITNNLDAALLKARVENKRVFIDFTGYTCTNCRWMEANMFVLPEVRAAMDNFVLASLYTDGEGDVYEQQQAFEQNTFGTVALPFYAVIDSNGTPIATFPGLTRNRDEFLDFLKKAQQ